MIPGTTIITNLRDRFFARLASRHKIGLLSVGWSTGAHFVGLFVRLFSNLVLTRLLAPEAYGIIGSALAVMTTLEWLSDMGVEPSLIRHPKGDTREFLITGWWVALGRGFVLALIAVTLAWPWPNSADNRNSLRSFS